MLHVLVTYSNSYVTNLVVALGERSIIGHLRREEGRGVYDYLHIDRKRIIDTYHAVSGQPIWEGGCLNVVWVHYVTRVKIGSGISRH